LNLIQTFSLATGCNTPRSSQAMLSIAAIKCSIAESPADFSEAHRMVHEANVMPGASFARAYNTLEYCDEQRKL
jgi:hypothetical protein